MAMGFISPPSFDIYQIDQRKWRASHLSRRPSLPDLENSNQTLDEVKDRHGDMSLSFDRFGMNARAKKQSTNHPLLQVLGKSANLFLQG